MAAKWLFLIVCVCQETQAQGSAISSKALITPLKQIVIAISV